MNQLKIQLSILFRNLAGKTEECHEEMEHPAPTNMCQIQVRLSELFHLKDGQVPYTLVYIEEYVFFSHWFIYVCYSFI
jgi:hypothetical protein